MRSLVNKARKRRLLFEEQKRLYELASQLLKSRESLLSNAYKQGFSQPANRTMSKLHMRKSKPPTGRSLFRAREMSYQQYYDCLYFAHA